jgi:hypothetical protein
MSHDIIGFHKRGWIRLLVLLFLAACSTPSVTPVSSELPSATAAPTTAVALILSTNTAVPPASATSPLPPTDTAVPPVETPIPPSATQAYTPTAALTNTPAACTNKARFVGETVPDDTAILAGSGFKKSWTLENSGTCTWTPGYTLRFDSGTFMGTDAQAFPLGKTVLPGERITLEVSLTAPGQPDTYTSNYLLTNEVGQTFGIGNSGTTPFYVRIVSIACTYTAALLKETYPPGTKVWMGEIFGKVWTLQNTGDCPWYIVRHPWVTDGGFSSPPGAPSSGNGASDAMPGGTVDLDLPLIAPMQAGKQVAEFKIGFYTSETYDTNMEIGLGPDGATPLTADILAVEPPASEANLGAPTIFDNFDKNEGWWSLEPNEIFDITGGALEMAIKQGYEYYNIRTMTERRGQVHQATFVTGTGCTGMNAYGLLFGLDFDKGTGSYNFGHLVRITCDGQYSVEFLDDTAYQSGNKPIILVPLTKTAAILAGPNQTNRLTVIGAGGRMIVIINGVKVVELEQAGEFKATQYENGIVTAQFELDLSKFFYTIRPYIDPGLPGLFIDGEESSHTVRVDEYKFWNLDEMLK